MPRFLSLASSFFPLRGPCLPGRGTRLAPPPPSLLAPPSLFPRQHRNYFVITRSLCGAKGRREAWNYGWVKTEMYTETAGVISSNNNKSCSPSPCPKIRSLSFSTDIGVEPRQRILHLLYKLWNVTGNHRDRVTRRSISRKISRFPRPFSSPPVCF